ncbi:MAG TPA: FliH/SctL family protein [Cellulomonas sp.]
MPESAFVPAQFPALASRPDGSPLADLLPVGFDRESSRAAGFAAGFAAGARAAARAAETAVRRATLEREDAARRGDERLEAALAALGSAARALSARTAPVLAEAEQALHEHALALAEAVLGVELQQDETSAAAALARVRAAAGMGDAVTVRLNPQDLSSLSGMPSLPAGVVLVSDPSLGRGEALAEQADGWLDARIGDALRRARAALDGGS